jgi:hypothetical protein
MATAYRCEEKLGKISAGCAQGRIKQGIEIEFSPQILLSGRTFQADELTQSH